MITPIYAAILALFYVWLSMRVIQMRQKTRVSLGEGNSKQLLRRLRIHGNFAEYVPFALLLILLVELNEMPDWNVHALGGLLIVSRTLHFIGLSREKDVNAFRVLGMVGTFTVLLLGALACLVPDFF
ncbi:MAPEG family protein [Pseudovibrio sp. SPO723]|uniref:MAPEG family protein n=1 Tax=Nesiotobacter zosterae TaxID=392721 RepID=UPI0029C3C149|nr:MAPEG family protein [Pseudovibrio sp. SPO723]MDX5594732.1 MAPEG family protein [Pseudovibrio sp. SPO723]